jgi:hypothetical protein
MGLAEGVLVKAQRALAIPAFFQYPITPINCERSELFSKFNLFLTDFTYPLNTGHLRYSLKKK